MSINYESEEFYVLTCISPAWKSLICGTRPERLSGIVSPQNSFGFPVLPIYIVKVTALLWRGIVAEKKKLRLWVYFHQTYAERKHGEDLQREAKCAAIGNCITVISLICTTG